MAAKIQARNRKKAKAPRKKATSRKLRTFNYKRRGFTEVEVVESGKGWFKVKEKGGRRAATLRYDWSAIDARPFGRRYFYARKKSPVLLVIDGGKLWLIHGRDETFEVQLLFAGFVQIFP